MIANPVSPAAFSLSMQALGLAEEKPFIAAAVSGGGDSLALALLLNDWATARGGKIIALTVDHGLRPGSAAEAQKTGEILQARNIAHKVLTWTGAKPATHIQERARQARYDLLAGECAAQDCAALALAHNLEDQTETFWMRLAHGSGLDGLVGMREASPLPHSGRGRGPSPLRWEGEGLSRPSSLQSERQVQDKPSPQPSPASAGEGAVTLLRPLLSFSRAELRATCAARGVQWIDDPSNENEKFLRPRLRQFEDLLAAEGLTPERLSRTMQKLSAAREALEFYAARAAADCVVMEDGEATLDPAAFRAHPRAIQSRVLAAVLDAVNPQDYPPGAEALEALRAAAVADTFTGRTLAGCEIFPHRKTLRIRREAAVKARGQG